MQRREFIALLGGIAAWPLAARAQQSTSVARIGYLNTNDASTTASYVEAFADDYLGRKKWQELLRSFS
jgi:hypothetical protein